MARAHVRIHEALEDFVSPKSRRGQPLPVSFEGRAGVKDLIEAAGVPHPEVDLILVDGTAVAFDHRVDDGQTVEVFPSGRGPPVSPEMRLIPPLPEPRRFVLDGHLARLAAGLRMLGFDAAGGADCADEELARISAEEDRILLTRDVGLLKRGIVRRGAFVRAVYPGEQVSEVVRRFDLLEGIHPFTRCLRCNAPLRPVEKEEVLHKLPPLVRERQEEFLECPSCGKVYWSGTHRERMQASIDRLLELSV
jgi:uncharacterized protein with PIN domain